MTDPVRHRRAKELFLQAAERDEPERVAFLESACAGDDELRAEVEGLLDAERARPDFLEASPASRLRAVFDVEEIAVPERIGAFRVVRLLGSGGMGHVFEVEQDDPHRRVALKVLRFGFAFPELRRRFELEKNALARLQHPGIAQIFEAGTAEVHGANQPYFAMELVDGTDLTGYVRSKALTARDRLELFVRIGAAVAHAHEHGVLHRDLKPANILVMADGSPKVLDFGIARAMDSSTTRTAFRTSASQIVGTLPYMSPEQATAHPDSIDERSDVFALGVILYELLTDELPLDVTCMPLPQAVRAICESRPRPISAIRRGLGKDLQTIVDKALEKEPSQRYASVPALVADVRHYLRGETIAARPTGGFRRLAKLVRRKPLLSGLVAALALAIVAAVWIWVDLAARAGSEQRKSYRAAIVAAARALDADTIESIAAARRELAECPAALRDWEWRYLGSKLEQSVDDTAEESILVLRGHTSYVYPVAISPDGRLIASGGWDSTVRLWDAASGADLRELAFGNGYLRSLAFDPKDHRLVAVGERHVRVWDTETGVQLALIGAGGAFCAGFSPDGSLLVIGHGEELQVLDGRTLADRAHVPAVSGTLAFAPDGQGFATANGSKGGPPSQIQIWTTDPVACVSSIPTSARVTSLCYSPDGALLAAADAGGGVSVWDAGRPRATALRSWRVEMNEVFAVAFLGPRRIATGGRDGSIRIWDADTGMLLLTLVGHESYVYSLAFGTDGERLVSGSGDRTVRIWETAPLARRIAARGGADAADSVAGRPDVRVNRALKLDGGNAVEVDMQAALENLQAFTVECWVRGEAPKAVAALVSNEEGEGIGLFARLDKLLPKGAFARGLLYTRMDRPNPAVTAPGPWRWQSWTHVALCFDGSSLDLFVDGRRADATPASTPLSPSSLPLYVGADPGRGGPECFFTGQIDELRVSRVARYHDAFTPAVRFESDPNTLLLLHFDSTIRGFHPDSSPGRHHGRPLGRPPRLVAAPR